MTVSADGERDVTLTGFYNFVSSPCSEQ